MGTQDEYLRNFTVLLTEKGVVPLTDPMQIAVYNELCCGRKRPSDISAALGLPSSSLHFVLDKMIDAGVIVKVKPETDRKSVYYANLALKIAGSTTPSEGTSERCAETFKNPSKYYTGLSAVANMLDSYADEIGLSLDQLRSKYAIDLADSMKYDIGRGEIEDSIVKIKERFASITGFRFSVFSLNPLTLVFEGSEVMSGEMDMLSAFVGRAVENATGRTLAITAMEDYSTEDSTRMKVVYERTEKVPEPYINMNLPHGDDSGRFIMVESDGSVGIITSPVQIDIIDAVYERPLCITDIVNKVEASRSTINSNILRMVEDGAISVFYSESGVAYYGLSCSILMKKVRRVDRDSAEIGSILKDTRTREGCFMEGYLRYILASLKGLGFDTDYMMVVLGAKYMRVAGNDGPKNFETFFGKMSSVAQSIGIALDVISVYPLTIGITSRDQDSKMSPAMTFVKGMAHQGLEMASNGIFVRVSDDTPTERKVSFKEIYPTLSMVPVENVPVEGLAEDAPAKKKRTSSVKTALKNRSARGAGRPMRTTRYITGVAVVALMAAVLVFGLSGHDDTDAGQFSVTMGDGCDGVMFYDSEKNEIEMPMAVDTSLRMSFFVEYLGGTQDLGIIKDGILYPLERLLECDENGMYTMSVTSDVVFRAITEMDAPSDESLSYSLYNFGSSVSDSRSYGFEGYIPMDEYIEAAGGLWVTSATMFCVTADDGYGGSASHDGEFLFDRAVFSSSEVQSASSMKKTSDLVSIRLDGSYRADGRFVSDAAVSVRSGSFVSLQFVGSITDVQIIYADAETERYLSQDVDHFVKFGIGGGDAVIYYTVQGIY